MAKELPKIYCNKCNYVQQYRGQANCIHCSERLNNWSVASQLAVQKNQKPVYDDSPGEPDDY